MPDPDHMFDPLVPPDFGGLIGYWVGYKAVVGRYGEGEPVEGIVFTPLNLLQVRKLIETLIEEGVADGRITAEHLRQSEELPMTPKGEQPMPRDEVDRIAGND